MLCAVQPFRVQPDSKKIPNQDVRPVLAIRELSEKGAKGVFSVIVADDSGNVIELSPGEFKVKG